MMRMFGSLVCISTRRVFSGAAESPAGTASASDVLFSFGKVWALIDPGPVLLTVVDLERSAAAPELFRRRD